MSAKDRVNMLFFDDDLEFLQTVSKWLEQAGYRVRAVSSPEATDAALQEKESDYGVIILDILLGDDNPVGLEILKALNPRESGAKVIMCSGTAEIDHAIRPINDGAFAYIRKGQTSAEEILRIVENAVDAADVDRRRRHDLEELKELQARLCHDVPTFAHFDLAVGTVPASVGNGDFYSFIELSAQQTGVFLGDVMGHGIAAAFVTGIAYATFAGIGDKQLGIEQPLTLLHKALKPLGEKTYVAASYCVLNDTDTAIWYNVLGQIPPIIHFNARSGECTRLTRSMSSVVHPALAFHVKESSRLPLSEDDLVVLCTDGVGSFDTDSEAAAKEVERIVCDNAQLPSAQLVSVLLAANKGEDDKTVIAIRAK